MYLILKQKTNHLVDLDFPNGNCDKQTYQTFFGYKNKGILPFFPIKTPNFILEPQKYCNKTLMNECNLTRDLLMQLIILIGSPIPSLFRLNRFLMIVLCVTNLHHIGTNYTAINT